MSKKLYLSGPMTGMPNENFELFEKAQKYYEGLGFDVINPHYLAAHTRLIHEIPAYKNFMGEDIRALSICDVIAFLPDWHNSAGCRVEFIFAKTTDIQLIKGFTTDPLKVDYEMILNFELEEAENQIMNCCVTPLNMN